MAFVDWDGAPFAPAWISNVNAGAPAFAAGSAATNMDAAGEEAGFVVEAPRTGNLKAIGFRVGTVTNNPDNGLRVAFYSSTSGLPNAETHFDVIAGPFSSNTFVTSGTVSTDGTDTGGLKAVTRGDRVTVVISFASFAVADNIQINQAMNSVFQGAGFSRGFPYTAQDVGAGWVKNGGTAEGAFNVALQYDDDVWYPLIACNPVSSFPTAVVLNSTSNPREVGMQFSLPVPMRVAGFQLLTTLANATTSTFDVHLYRSGTAGAVESKSVAGADEAGGGTGTGQAIHAWFDTAQELAAGDAVHSISVTGTGAGNVTVYPVSYASIALRNASPLGGTYRYFTAVAVGGARVLSTTDQMTLIPIFDGIEGGAPRARYILGGI